MCPDDYSHGWWTEQRLRLTAIGHLPFASLPEAVGFTCRRELTLRRLTEREKTDHTVNLPKRPVPDYPLEAPDYRLEDQRVTLELEGMYEWLVTRGTASTPDPQAIYTPSSEAIRVDRRYAIAAELSSIDDPTSKFRRWLDELDNEEILRDYLCHMLDHCPWLRNDWKQPGFALLIDIAGKTAKLGNQICAFRPSANWDALVKLARNPGVPKSMEARRVCLLKRALKDGGLDAVADAIGVEPGGSKGRYSLRTAHFSVRVVELKCATEKNATIV